MGVFNVSMPKKQSHLALFTLQYYHQFAFMQQAERLMSGGKRYSLSSDILSTPETLIFY